MTEQELFNNAWQHFVVEKNPPGFDPDSGYCCYRVRGNAHSKERCAIGISIPDELYDPDMDSGRYDLNDIIEICDWDVSEVFAIKLQSVHDHAAKFREDFYEIFTKGLRNLARDYQLEIPADAKA